MLYACGKFVFIKKLQTTVALCFTNTPHLFKVFFGKLMEIFLGELLTEISILINYYSKIEYKIVKIYCFQNQIKIKILNEINEKI